MFISIRFGTSTITLQKMILKNKNHKLKKIDSKNSTRSFPKLKCSSECCCAFYYSFVAFALFEFPGVVARTALSFFAKLGATPATQS